jgi:predicted RND superfamily exporter protein
MVHYLIRFAKPVLALGVLAIVTSLYWISGLGFSYDIERFFPENDDDAAFMAAFSDRIERDDLFLLVAIDNGESIYDSVFLQKLTSFTNACRDLPGIETVSSLTNFKDPIKTPFGLSFRQVLHPDQPERYAADSMDIRQDTRLYNNLLAADEKAVNVVLRTYPSLSQATADSLDSAINALIAHYGFEKTHIAGVANTQSVFVAKIKKEMLFYISLSILITSLLLFWLYRSLLGVFIPMVSVLGALVLFLAYMRLSGQLLDIMSSMYPMLMMIFGMSDLIHLQSKYIDEMEKGKSSFDAILYALKEIGLALFLTSLTTAIGFAALLTSAIPAIRDFGLNAAMGVMLAYGSVVVFSAALLSLFNANQLQKVKNQQLIWDKIAHKLYHFAIVGKLKVVLTTLVVVLVCVWGIGRISTNTYLLGDLPLNSKLRTDFQFFENRFSGVRTLELAIQPQPGHALFSAAVLQEVEKLEAYLADSITDGGIQSPVMLTKTMNKSWSGGLKSAYKLPEDSSIYKTFSTLLQKNKQLSQFALFDSSLSLGRVSLRVRDTGSDSLSYQMRRIERWIEKNTDPTIARFRFTGSGLMVDKNNEYLRNNLLQGLLLAFCLVGIIFSLLFRDWRMLFISILPNLIPLLVAGAMLGFLNIELKAVTSIIFTVSFGIAVDDTIHFLTRYKIERAKGNTVGDAMLLTFQISGKAILLTTLILIAGFISLTFSDFTGTYYVGIIVCITLISALISDLFLIPQLLFWINPGSRKAALKKLHAE